MKPFKTVAAFGMVGRERSIHDDTTMDSSKQLAELEQIAQTLRVKVSYEPMSGLVQGTGGLCRVRGELRIIIDKRLKPPERIQLLADALRRFDVSAQPMSARTRDLLAG